MATNELSAIIDEFKSILGPEHSSMMISNKWLPNHSASEYFILNFSAHYLRLLEHHDTIKNEYELALETGVIKVNGEEKNYSFVVLLMEKVDKIMARLVVNEAQVYFKTKAEK
jgi:hypothetical protein